MFYTMNVPQSASMSDVMMKFREFPSNIILKARHVAPIRGKKHLDNFGRSEIDVATGREGFWKIDYVGEKINFVASEAKPRHRSVSVMKNL